MAYTKTVLSTRTRFDLIGSKCGARYQSFEKCTQEAAQNLVFGHLAIMSSNLLARTNSRNIKSLYKT
jgi:hypothetical protein